MSILKAISPKGWRGQGNGILLSETMIIIALSIIYC